MSLSKMLRLHCLELVQPRKRPEMTEKIVNWDVKSQPYAINVFPTIFFNLSHNNIPVIML